MAGFLWRGSTAASIPAQPAARKTAHLIGRAVSGSRGHTGKIKRCSPNSAQRACQAHEQTVHATRLGQQRLAVQTADQQVFDFQIIVHAVVRAFAAEAGLFDAAKRRGFVGDNPGVDADHAVFQLLSRPPDAADVAAVENRLARPNSVSLAMATTSASVSNLNSGASGPKVSSLWPLSSPGSRHHDGRLQSCRPGHGACRQPPACRPWPGASAMCSSLCHGFFVDHRAFGDAGLKPLPTLSWATAAANFSAKRVITPFARTGGWRRRRFARRCGIWRSSRLQPRASRSASSNTMNGALPPSSIETFSPSAAHWAISSRRSRSSR